jgi:rhamnulokinase
MNPLHFLAFDLGATSGRAILGTLAGGQLSLQELTRFPNAMLALHGKCYWNIYSLYAELKNGIAACIQRGVQPDAIGIDTWGVDFVLFGKQGEALSLPRAYRDPYTKGVQQQYFQRVPAKEVYEKTGIQFMDFNTLFQLYALKKENPTLLKAAQSLLFMPDALSYLLTGKKVCEHTIASTGQLLNPRTKQIERSLLDAIDVPVSLFQPPVQPGTVVGALLDEVCRETGARPVPVVAVAGHDTAAAIAAIPAGNERFAYLSSGTWSLMGIEVKAPVIDDVSFRLNYTNEGGVEGATLFLKNITGLWLLEECRREWQKAGVPCGYAGLQDMAEASSFHSLIDPDDPLFAHPESMTGAIAAYCTRTQQPAPDAPAEFARCIFASLAQKYKHTLDDIKTIAPHPIERLHVIGGGSQNRLLNRLTATATGLPVVAGPAEATAIGNIMLQAKAMGAVNSLSEMRNIIRASTKPQLFEP